MEKAGGLRSNMAAGAWAVIVILASPVMLLAQVTGTMSGYVKDSSGSVVPQAKVTATLVQRGTAFVAETNAEGFYNFPALDPGAYTLAVEKQGFQRNLQTGLTLTVGQNLRVDASLTVGQLAQEVEVTAQAPLVDTMSGTVSSLVDDRRIVDLPLNGRNVMGLAELVPGVLGVYSPESLTSARGGPQMNVNGNRGNQNLFTFDGALFINPSRNTGMNLPPPDAVQEFRFQTSNFDAEYGRNSGSQAMVVARAGSNSFHGDVWEFLRNNALNARNFFAPTVPAIKENQFGGTAGGAIKKNKLFFFGAYQGLRNRPQAVAQEVLVPSAAERTGDFTDLLPGTVLTNPVNPNNGQPFTTPSGAPCVANNIIDPSCITTPSKNLLQYVPVTPSGTVVSLGSSPVNDNMYLGRIDVIISPKQTLFAHAFVDKNSSSTAFPGGSNIAGYNSASRPAETDDFAVNDTYTFKPTLVNQAVVSFLRTTSTFQLAQTVAPMTIGINMPQYVPNGTIGASVSGSFNLNGSGFNLFKNNNWQFRDSLTWTKGRHEFKMGGEVLPLHFLQRFIGTPGFSFNGSRSGNAFADYLLGAFNTMSVGFGIADNDDLTTALSFFFQDQFKATPRLTLTYGLRWEPNFFWHDKHNRIDTVKIGEQSQVVPDAPPGIVFPGDPGITRSIVGPQWNAFAPRIGFAWDVFGDGKTSVRGGYGVFFNQLNADTLAQQNAPYSGVFTAYNGNWVDPFGSTGTTPPPVAPTGHFGCVPISTPPGLNCPLYPLPVFGYFIDGSLRTPYLQSWNLAVQRQIKPSIMLEVGYVGNMGIKLNNIRNFNPARFIPGTVYDPVAGLENTLSNPSNLNDRVLYEPGILAPYAWVLGNDFRSWYNSFQVQLTKRMSHGFSVTSSYTLAKAIDMCSYTCEACGCVSNPFNLRSIRGRANFDRRNAFVISWVWTPPLNFSDRWKNALLGGWTFSGITAVQSGLPMTFSYGSYGLDVAVNGTVSAPQHAFPTGEAIPLNHPSRSAMINEFFNTNAFVDATCTYDSAAAQGNPQYIEQNNCTPFGIKYSLLGQYGATGRNILSGPAFSSTDFAILKVFPFKERYQFQFRSEFFNAFNQVNFNNPDSSVIDGPAFGTIQSTLAAGGQIGNGSTGRVIQFALKFLW